MKTSEAIIQILLGHIREIERDIYRLAGLNAETIPQLKMFRDIMIGLSATYNLGFLTQDSLRDLFLAFSKVHFKNSDPLNLFGSKWGMDKKVSEETERLLLFSDYNWERFWSAFYKIYGGD